jgi:hypothetical protein
MYKINPLQCPKCKSQMRIIAFFQDEHSIKDIMKSQGIPDFQAPPPIPNFIDTEKLSMNSPPTTHLNQHLMTSKNRFLRDGGEGVYLKWSFKCGF